MEYYEAGELKKFQVERVSDDIFKISEERLQINHLIDKITELEQRVKTLERCTKEVKRDTDILWKKAKPFYYSCG